MKGKDFDFITYLEPIVCIMSMYIKRNRNIVVIVNTDFLRNYLNGSIIDVKLFLVGTTIGISPA